MKSRMLYLVAVLVVSNLACVTARAQTMGGGDGVPTSFESVKVACGATELVQAVEVDDATGQDVDVLGEMIIQGEDCPVPPAIEPDPTMVVDPMVPSLSWRFLNRLSFDVGLEMYSLTIFGQDQGAEIDLAPALSLDFRVGEAIYVYGSSGVARRVTDNRSQWRHWEELGVRLLSGDRRMTLSVGARNSLSFMQDGKRDQSLLAEIRGGVKVYGDLWLQAHIGTGFSWFWRWESNPTSCSSEDPATSCVAEGFVPDQGAGLDLGIGMFYRF